MKKTLVAAAMALVMVCESNIAFAVEQPIPTTGEVVCDEETQEKVQVTPVGEEEKQEEGEIPPVVAEKQEGREITPIVEEEMQEEVQVTPAFDKDSSQIEVTEIESEYDETISKETKDATVEVQDENDMETVDKEVEMAVEETEQIASDNSGVINDTVFWSVEGDTLYIYSKSANGKIPDYTNKKYAPWYLFRASVCQVVIESDISEIGAYAFYEMNALEQVTIRTKSLTGIGDHAFDKCINLKQINLPDSLQELGIYAFADCKNLTSISSNGFVIPSGLSYIPAYAFAQCSGISDVTISESVNMIEECAFYYCGSMKTVSVRGNALEEIGDYAFAASGLEKVVVPNGIRALGDRVFYGCNSLKVVEMKEQGSLEKIGEEAFENCVALSQFWVMADTYSANYALNDSKLKEIQKIYSYLSNGNSYYGIEVNENNFYTGKEVKPAVTITDRSGYKLQENVDYTLSYCNNVEIGDEAKIIITGINGYYGIMEIYFSIVQVELANAVTVEGIAGQLYTGKEVRPKVKIAVNGSGNELRENIDYTLSYSNNINVGDSAKVRITGINGYYGTMEIYFSIIQLDITNAATLGNIAGQFYTGKEVRPDVKVIVNGVVLVKGKDYSVSYKNNINIGTSAKVVVTGKGSYTGRVEKSFSIISEIEKAQVTVKKQVYTGKKLQPKVTVKLNHKVLRQGKDYKVSYSNNKKIGKNAKVVIKGIGVYSGTISKKFTIAPPKPKAKISKRKLKISNYCSGADIYLKFTAAGKGKKSKGTLLWQAKKYKSKKCVDLTQLVKKYKGRKITITVTMKVNGVESASSKKVTIK